MKIGVGVIGCGSFSRTHLQNLGARDDVELVSVCDIVEDQAKRYRTEFGAKDYALDYRRLLSDQRINAVMIVVPQGLHAQIAIEAALSGKHVFCEKPMAMSVKECRAIRNAVERAKVALQVGYVLRFSRDIVKVKEWLPLIGRPVLFRDMWSPSPWASPHPWVFDDKMGGGPLFEASHWIDFANFLFGVPRRVYASMHHFKPGSFTAPDTFLLVVDYEAGDRVVWSDAECLPGLEDYYVRNSSTRPHLSIIGPNGSIHFPSPDGSKVSSLYLNHHGREPFETHAWESDWGATQEAYPAELDNFFKCIKTAEKNTMNTAEDGEWVVQVAEASRLSHITQRPIQLPLDGTEGEKLALSLGAEPKPKA